MLSFIDYIKKALHLTLKTFNSKEAPILKYPRQRLSLIFLIRF